MAQRAYRQRKESTLEELRRRVSELTNTAERMNRAFRECQDRLTAAGLSEAQLQDLRECTFQYTELMKIARNPSYEDDTVTGAELDIHRSATSSSQLLAEEPAIFSTGKNVPSWLDQAALSAQPKQRSPLDVGLGYTAYVSENEDTGQVMDFGDLSNQAQAIVPLASKQQPLDIWESLQLQGGETLNLSSQLSPPMTYSFQETSFSRRLHRSCLEAGYQLLLDPARRPHTYDRVFKLSLMSRDRAKMTASLKSMLSRGPHESLDFWEAPLLHVGGAGTHYPRKDQYGNILPKKDSYHLGLIGPQTLALLENAAKDHISADMTVEIAGFEGQWLDPQDVEGYLEEKGIHIDPTDSFCEAELVDLPPTPDSLSSNTLPHTPREYSTADRTAPFDYEQSQRLNMFGADLSMWDESTNMQFSGVGYSDAVTGSWMNFIPPNEAGKTVNAQQETTLPDAWEGSGSVSYLNNEQIDLQVFSSSGNTSSRKRVVIIDVAKFVRGEFKALKGLAIS